MEDSNNDISYQISRQKIIFVGDVCVGKTSMINSLLGKKFSDEYEPSIGVDFFSKVVKFKTKQVKFQIWDSAGQEKFRSLIPNYIRGASLIFLVYDITSKDSFFHLPEWLKFINNIETTLIVIVGNKIDMDDKRKVSTEEGREFAEKNNLEFYEISAINSKMITEIFLSSIANLPLFSNLSGGNITKEEILDNLQKENIADSKISNHEDEGAELFRINKDKEEEMEPSESQNNNKINISDMGNELEKNIIDEKVKKKKCCFK